MCFTVLLILPLLYCAFSFVFEGSVCSCTPYILSILLLYPGSHITVFKFFNLQITSCSISVIRFKPSTTYYIYSEVALRFVSYPGHPLRPCLKQWTKFLVTNRNRLRRKITATYTTWTLAVNITPFHTLNSSNLSMKWLFWSTFAIIEGYGSIFFKFSHGRVMYLCQSHELYFVFNMILVNSIYLPLLAS